MARSVADASRNRRADGRGGYIGTGYVLARASGFGDGCACEEWKMPCVSRHRGTISLSSMAWGAPAIVTRERCAEEPSGRR